MNTETQQATASTTPTGQAKDVCQLAFERALLREARYLAMIRQMQKSFNVNVRRAIDVELEEITAEYPPLP